MIKRIGFLLPLLFTLEILVGVGPILAQTSASGQVFWKGSSGPYNIEWSTANLKATRSDTGAVVFDAAVEAEKEWKNVEKEDPDASFDYARTYQFLSLVGPYLSFEVSYQCDCGGAHPEEYTRFRTVDLSRGGADAQLNEVFPDSQLLRALLDDKIVKGALGKTSPAPAKAEPKSVAQLLQALDLKEVKLHDCYYHFNKDTLLSSFVFYDFKGADASVRISLSHAVEVCRGQMTQLGLTLSAPESLRTALAGAKQKHAGLLMFDAPHEDDTKVTSFSFTHNE
jgi:hypothetical protein